MALQLTLHQFFITFDRFTAGFGVVAVQAVQTCTGMGVDHHQGGVFFKQVVENGNQRGVLEHIRMVAGMEGVAITKHALIINATAHPMFKHAEALYLSIACKLHIGCL